MLRSIRRATLMMLVASAVAVPAASADDLEVSLESSTPTVEVPGSFVMAASSAPGINAGQTLVIVDDEDEEVLRNCSSWESYCAHQQQVGWERNHEHEPYKFHAEVRERGTTNVLARSPQVVVDVEPFDFDVTVSASPEQAPMPGNFQVSADPNLNPAYSHKTVIINDESGEVVRICNRGEDPCVHQQYSDWNRNGPGTPFQFHAEIRYGDEVVARSEDLVVPVVRKRFAVAMGFSLVSGFNDLWNSGASISPTVANTGLATQIEKSDGTVINRCTRYWEGEYCPGGFVGTGTYRARVLDGEGFASGHSPWYTLDEDGVHSNDIGGIDLFTLATDLGGAQGVCTAIGAAPTPYLRWRTLNDLYFACETAVSQGLTARQILLRIAGLTGGFTAITWLWAQTTDETVVAPSDHPPTQEGDPDSNDPRPPAPVTWNASTDSEVDDFLARNRSELGNDRALAERVRNRCTSMRVEAAARGATGDAADPDECDSLPMFVAGTDYPSVTDHDRDAIRSRWQWGRLHYSAAGNPRGWIYNTDACRDAEEGKQCDEFPFASAREGGNKPLPEERPSTRMVKASDNTNQGSKLGVFVKYCLKAKRGGDGQEYLVVPLAPPREDIPTVGLCNVRP